MTGLQKIIDKTRQHKVFGIEVISHHGETNIIKALVLSGEREMRWASHSAPAL
jgi:hypothetical protein